MVVGEELLCPEEGVHIHLEKEEKPKKLKQMNTKELLLESASSRWGKAVGWISNAGSAFYESSLWEIFVLQVSPL